MLASSLQGLESSTFVRNTDIPRRRSLGLLFRRSLGLLLYYYYVIVSMQLVVSKSRSVEVRYVVGSGLTHYNPLYSSLGALSFVVTINTPLKCERGVAFLIFNLILSSFSLLSLSRKSPPLSLSKISYLVRSISCVFVRLLG